MTDLLINQELTADAIGAILKSHAEQAAEIERLKAELETYKDECERHIVHGSGDNHVEIMVYTDLRRELEIAGPQYEFVSLFDTVMGLKRKADEADAAITSRDITICKLREGLIQLNQAIDNFWNDPQRPSIVKMKSPSVERITHAQQGSARLLTETEEAANV